MSESYPWEFKGVGGGLYQPLAHRYGDTWKCAIPECDFTLADTADVDDAVMNHAATRHPKATAEATGKNPEELAARYPKADPKAGS